MNATELLDLLEEPLIVENGKRRSSDTGDIQYSTQAIKRPRTTSHRTDDDDDNRFKTENVLIDTPTNSTRASSRRSNRFNEEQVEIEEPQTRYRVSYRRVLKHIPQDIPYVPVTTENGSRLYLRLLQKKNKVDEETEEEENCRMLISTAGGSNKKLFNDWGRIKAEARILKDKFHRTLSNIVEKENIMETLGVENVKGSNEALWVEKYKPRGYLDLLSEESVNKTLLHWLKLWDKSVFGNDYLARVKAHREKYAQFDAEEKERSEKMNKYQPRQQQMLINEDFDEQGRPKVKVALLHGQPGLGKTTCAHVIAKHAGYNVREMNASDDRSIEIFRKTLDDVTQSKSETFTNGKPNCLIIDEIDGAPAATVKVLIDLITGVATEVGKKKLKKVLKRPIICICNDLYAPSLKELKKHVLVLHFSPVTVSSLAERLQEISNQEKLDLDSTTVKSLCEKSECDIRSCLSTLQFLKKKRCTPKDALFSQIGVKDKSKGIFSVWTDIFSIPESKSRYYETADDPSKSDARFRSVMRVVQNFGEYEKLLGGVFHNYLNTRFKDCYFESIIEGLGWTTWFQELNMSIEQNQNYALMGYLPIYFVVSHFLYAQRGWVKINYPSNEMAARIPKCRNIISNLQSDMLPSVGRFLDPYNMVADLFPALLSITQPTTIRPVPTQIWSARERETLRNIVEVMITYNLSYSQIKSQETGTYNFVLEPDIEEITKFKLQDSSSMKRAFPYAVKQLIAREIDVEKLRRSDSLEGATTETSTNSKDAKKLSEFKVPSKPVPRITPKIITDPTAAVAKDFFGRIVALSAQNTQDMLAQKRRSTGIYFKFNEGYSNAVRRFVKMKDLV